MAFEGIRPALTAGRDDFIFWIACFTWTVVVLATMMLARDNAVLVRVIIAATAIMVLGWPWLRRMATFATIAASLAVLLAASEAIIRAKYFGLDAVRYSTAARYKPIDAMADPAYLQPAPEPGLVYTLRPGFRGWVKGAFIAANNYGVREREIPLERPEGTVRVMTCGTSITMGEGVAAEQTFTADLGRLLSGAGYPAETVNFGIGGYTLGTAQGLLTARGLQFHPDVVVQELTVATLRENKHSMDELWEAFQQARSAPPRASFFEENSFATFAIYPPLLLRVKLDGLRTRRPATPPRAVTLPDQYVADTVASFGKRATANGFLGVLFVPRPIDALGNRQLHEREREIIRRLAVANKLVYVDSYDRFSAADEVEALSIFPAELHPNGVAHRRYAAALFDALAPIVRDLAARRHPARGQS